MVLSMTGFGRAEGVCEGKKITIDVKSLNSKNFDLNLKLPFRYKEREFDLRKKVNEKLGRGKIDLYLSYENQEKAETSLNKPIIKSYMEQLATIAQEDNNTELLKMAIRLPDSISTDASDVSEEEWKYIDHILENSLKALLEFRKTEGNALYQELSKSIEAIQEKLENIPPYEEERINFIKEKYKAALQEFENVDEARYYQEIAYFMEKIDISEEKVRLKQHLQYFLEVMEKEECNGKKLGFISQEIGREINTLGSKANHHEIQKLVVVMKDELEKIKEQCLNVL